MNENHEMYDSRFGWLKRPSAALCLDETEHEATISGVPEGLAVVPALLRPAPEAD